MSIQAWLRHGASFLVAGGLTWWFLFRVQAPALLQPSPGVPAPLLQIAHGAGPAAPEALPEPQPESSEPDHPEAGPAAESPDPGKAPAAEAGSRDGDADGELQERVEQDRSAMEAATQDARVDGEGASPAESSDGSVVAGEAATDPTSSLEELEQDVELLKAARQELDGDVRLGFSTQFLCAAGDQLDIARAFNEQVVLIPRSALDDTDKAASSYVLDMGRGGGVKRIAGRPDLSRFRQYRDLFGFEFSSLPEPIRRLRTSVVRRDEVFLFAALIPAREWAVAVGRRREALGRIDRTEDEVERFVLRYIAAGPGRFDFEVAAIDFSDGSSWRPKGAPMR